MNFFRTAASALFVVSWLFFVSASSSSAATTLSEMQSHVMCMCPDHCGKVLESCTCKYSDDYRRDITTMINKGMSKEEILAEWVGKYGEKGLSAPTKEGFNLTAWIMPFFAIFLALGLVAYLVRKWAVPVRQKEAEGAGKKKLTAEEKRYAEQLKRELDQF